MFVYLNLVLHFHKKNHLNLRLCFQGFHTFYSIKHVNFFKSWKEILYIIKSFLCCQLKASIVLVIWAKNYLSLRKPNLPMWVVLQITLVRTIYFYPLRPLYLREATRGGIQSLYSIRADGQQDLLAISCKLPAYFSLEINQFLQITWETFSAEHKPSIGKVLF